MNDRKRAYFIHRPRRLADLLLPHLPEAERNYEIVATVELAKPDYENFSEDLLADRVFLEGYAKPVIPGKALPCVLVRQQGCPDGTLVVVYQGSMVRYAAYYCG